MHFSKLISPEFEAGIRTALYLGQEARDTILLPNHGKGHL